MVEEALPAAEVDSRQEEVVAGVRVISLAVAQDLHHEVEVLAEAAIQVRDVVKISQIQVNT